MLHHGDPLGPKDDVPNLKILLIGNSSVGKSSLLLRFASSTFLPPDESSATIGVDFKIKTIFLADPPDGQHDPDTEAGSSKHMQSGTSGRRGGRRGHGRRDGLGQDGDPDIEEDDEDAEDGNTLGYAEYADDESDRTTGGIRRGAEGQGRKVKLSIWDTAGQERFRVLTGSYYRGAMGVVLVYDVTSRDSFEELVRWLREVETFCVQGVKRLLVGNKVDREFSRQVSTDEGRQFAARMGTEFLECSAMSDIGVDEIFDQLARSPMLDSYHHPHVGFGPKRSTCKKKRTRLGVEAGQDVHVDERKHGAHVDA